MRKMLTVWLSGLLVVFFLGTMPVQAADTRLSRMEDYADLLTSYEEDEIRNMLDHISEELQFDIVIVTTDSTGGKSSEAYADDFFDYNGYGVGENYDGVLLLINMEYREWHITTTGYGMQAISDSEVEEIGDEIVEYLSYGEYAEAFQEFARLAEKEVKRERDSETLDVGEILFRFVIALAVGMGLAFIPVTIMKKKLNNVAAKNEAADYLKRDQVRMTAQRDMFLYSTISRRRKPQENSSRSGGHVGSSGRSHGGGGGRF